MTLVLCIAGAIVLGTGFGLFITWLFGKFPEDWLQDYGVKDTDPDYRVSKRMRWVPEGVIACIFCAVSYVVAVIFCGNSYITTFKPLHLLVIVLLIPDLILVMMSDKLNRIIPDQFSAYIAVVGVLFVFALRRLRKRGGCGCDACRACGGCRSCGGCAAEREDDPGKMDNSNKGNKRCMQNR